MVLFWHEFLLIKDYDRSRDTPTLPRVSTPGRMSICISTNGDSARMKYSGDSSITLLCRYGRFEFANPLYPLTTIHYPTAILLLRHKATSKEFRCHEYTPMSELCCRPRCGLVRLFCIWDWRRSKKIY
jgi:hypothetical protein